jgi:hypothetical protein
MVRPVSGSGPVQPPQEPVTQIAQAFQNSLKSYVLACTALNPNNNLAEFAQNTVALAKLAQDAQKC